MLVGVRQGSNLGLSWIPPESTYRLPLYSIFGSVQTITSLIKKTAGQE